MLPPVSNDPLKLRPLSDPWSESINQESIGPFRLSCRLGMVRSSPMIHNLHRCQKCIEFSMKWVPLSVATATGTPNLKITCSVRNLVLSNAVAWAVARVSVHFVNASVQVIMQDFPDDVMGRSMIQSRYKRSNGSTTQVGRSSFDFGHLLHC